MNNIILILIFTICAFNADAQNIAGKIIKPKEEKKDFYQMLKDSSVPVTINWVDELDGDYSFSKEWSYPLGVEVKTDGKAGCADGGFCPQRCYAMMDSNWIVMKDSAEIFYQLLDTTHEFHSIQCEAWCYEWNGTDFIRVTRLNNDTIYCDTRCGIATHSSFQLDIFKDICYSSIDLNSIVSGGDAIYYCTTGYIKIDKNLWEKGIMKAEFSFNYRHDESPKKPMFWKGRIYAKIATQ